MRPTFLNVAAVSAALLAVSAPAGDTKVIAYEIVETRKAALKAPANAEGNRFSFDRPGMKVILEAQGDDIAASGSFGMMELTADDDKGGKLKVETDRIFHNYFEEFAPFDRNSMFMGEENPPKDAIRIEIPFECPPRTAATISLRGKFQLKRIETIDVVVPVKVGEVKHEKLEAHGLNIKIVKSDSSEIVSFEATGKLEALGETAVLDAQDKPLEPGGRSAMTMGSKMQCDLTMQEAVPADAKLKFSVIVSSRDVPVAFELKDIKLP